MASRIARIALGHVEREYPHKLDHVLEGDRDLRPPRALHPVFFGSFDWHSCVHSWWTLLTVRRLFPQITEAEEIERLAEGTFTRSKIEAELAYLARPSSRGFERPYGWAWLLYLHLEADRHPRNGWAARIEPLAQAFAARLNAYLATLTYPVRSGAHANTAFALVLALEWAEKFDLFLADRIRARVVEWFREDRAAQAWEPSGDDFLSPTLIEAVSMCAVLPDREAKSWLAAFLPRIREVQPATLFEPAYVSDRTDGKIAHLDGLNLSRGWCWQRLAHKLSDEEQQVALRASDNHFASAFPHISGDYMGEHWLATFAVLALEPASQGECRAGS
jgi:hypothetical protein